MKNKEKQESKKMPEIPQKYLVPLFLGVFAVLMGGYLLSNLFLNSSAEVGFSGALGAPAAPAPSVAVSGTSSYFNKEFGFSVKYPSDWATDALAGDASGNVMFRPKSMKTACFTPDAVCPIGIIVAENRKNKPLQAFSDGFYPDKGWAQGGTEVVPVGNAMGERFFNFGGIGAQLVFVQRNGYIVKFYIQGKPEVTLDALNVFEKMLASFEFSDLPVPKK